MNGVRAIRLSRVVVIPLPRAIETWVFPCRSFNLGKPVCFISHVTFKLKGPTRERRLSQSRAMAQTLYCSKAMACVTGSEGGKAGGPKRDLLPQVGMWLADISQHHVFGSRRAKSTQNGQGESGSHY